MAHAIFNETGDDELPPLEPEADELLVAASVRVSVGPPNPKVLKYTLPELSGAGAVYTGLGPERITWTINAFATCNENYIAFANKLRQYLATAQSYTMRGTRGEVWEHMRMAAMRPTAPPEDCGSGEVWCGWEVGFEWMQPATEVGMA